MAISADIWSAAKDFMDRYGAHATMQAAMNADAALDAGDRVKMNRWIAIKNAIQELERTSVDGERLN